MKENSSAHDRLASIGKLMKLKPDTATSFVNLDQQVFKEEALSTKVKELIAIGAAHATRCPYCIEAHVNRALKAGASDEEIAEAVFVGVALNAGAAFAHSCFAMDCLNK
ncbi:MAG: carboxymuconolactone decarboxylase family protein [Deltaproteobacteria bacterium]|nr:carboxymuconolactone decarboxylase family protein [Deltaproteobacteria bacterium]